MQTECTPGVNSIALEFGPNPMAQSPHSLTPLINGDTLDSRPKPLTWALFAKRDEAMTSIAEGCMNGK
jgi:hypothetical protein